MIEPYLTLVRIEPFDPVADARTTIYIASAGDRRITGLNGVVWVPALLEQPTLGIRLFNGDFQAPVEPGTAGLQIQMGAVRQTYSVADRCNWAGAEVEIYAGRAGDAWPWTSVFKGRVTTFDRRTETLRLSASVDTEPFEKNVLTDVYAGTGGNEGGADLKDRPKPLVIGWASSVEPVLIDATNSVYQFSGYGAIEAVTALYERASDFGASVGDYGTYALLVAASIPRGRWATCLAEGLVRLGAPAAGVITGDLKGHKVGTTTPRLTGAVIDALADIAGVDGALIEPASLTALDAAAPYPVNLVLTEQTKWIDLARRMALPCNYQAGVSFGGKFFVLGVNLTGTAEFTLDTAGTSEPLVIEGTEQTVSPPYYRTIMGAARAWRVHNPDEIAFYAPLIERGDYSASETYREGNWVTYQGSSWLYINPMASSGNAPPTLPTTSNTYWQVMAKAGDDGADGANGANGLSNALVYLYRRSASTPAAPSGTFTYTFATNALSGGTLNGWSQTIPAADGNPLWVIVATASASTATDTIAATEFSSPVKLTQDGAAGSDGSDGASGLNAATVFLFQRAASTPAKPASALTYTFATGVLSGTLGSWSQTVPTANGNPLWVTTATAASTAATDTIATTEWAAVTKMAQDGTDGLPGTNGTNGTTFYTWVAYANAPDGSIDFTTGSPGSRAYIGLAHNKTSATESTTPADYTWSQYKGPPNFGLVASSGAVVAGNSAIKSASGSAWTEQVYSSEGYRSGAFASFKIPAGIYAMAGLNTDPTTNSSYETLDYAIYGIGTGEIYAYESGTGVVLSAGPRTGNEVLRVVYDNKTVSYYIDGSLVRQIAVAADKMLYFDSSLYSGSGAGRVTDIAFGPVGSAGVDGADGADGSDGAPGAPGADGNDGSDGLNGVSAELSVNSFVIPADSAGTVTSGLPATGLMKMYYGGADVSASAAFAEVSETGCTGTTTDTASGGSFSVTAMSADYATYVLQGTYTPPGGSAVTIQKTVTLTKAKAGANGNDGSDGGNGVTFNLSAASGFDYQSIPVVNGTLTAGFDWSTENSSGTSTTGTLVLLDDTGAVHSTLWSNTTTNAEGFESGQVSYGPLVISGVTGTETWKLRLQCANAGVGAAGSAGAGGWVRIA